MRISMALFVALIFGVVLACFPALAEVSTRIFVQGVPIETQPIVCNGVTYLPLRAVAQSLHCDVQWFPERGVFVWSDQTLAHNAKDSQPPSGNAEGMEVKQGNRLFVDGRLVQAQLLVQNDTTYVPLRAVAEALNCDVIWRPNRGIFVAKRSPRDSWASTREPEYNDEMQGSENMDVQRAPGVLPDYWSTSKDADTSFRGQEWPSWVPSGPPIDVRASVGTLHWGVPGSLTTWPDLYPMNPVEIGVVRPKGIAGMLFDREQALIHGRAPGLRYQLPPEIQSMLYPNWPIDWSGRGRFW